VGELFAVITRLAVGGFSKLKLNVPGKYSDNRSTKNRLFVEEPRRRSFNCFAQGEKLRHTCVVLRTLHAGEFVERSVADLTENDLFVVQHGEPEGQPFLVMPEDFVRGQRHGGLFRTVGFVEGQDCLSVALGSKQILNPSLAVGQGADRAPPPLVQL